MRRLRVASSAKPAAAQPTFELRDGAIPVLTVRSFWSAKGTALTAFVATASKVRDAKAVLVDVRHNGGGSDTYAIDWVAQLTDRRLPAAVVDRLDSEVTRQGIINDNTCEIAEGGLDEGALRDAKERLAYGERVVTEVEASGRPLRVWKPRTITIEGRAPAPFRGPVVALIDNECASACESFVSHARQLERTVVVGENSGGVGVFGEVLVYRLPRSGLGMSAGMKYFHDPDPARDVPEGRGHLPDYWLDSDDTLKLTERIAECVAKPGCALR